MIYANILGTGAYLPKQIVTNKDLERKIDTTDEWIVSRTGIRERRCAASDETASSMGVIAAREALKNAGIDADEIDLIVVATTTPDKIFPNTACFIQAALNIKDCIAFDVSAACAGFMYALGCVNSFIKSGGAKKALVIGSELMMRTLDWSDRGTCILFGDGAGAVVFGASAQPGVESVHLHADGQQQHILHLNHPGFGGDDKSVKANLWMKGNDVFKFAVTHLEGLVNEALTENNLQAKDIDWLVPHQANIRIIQALAKRLKLPMERVLLTIEKHGNTSAASVPLALHEGIKSGAIKRGERILLEAFGGGLVWGSALIKY